MWIGLNCLRNKKFTLSCHTMNLRPFQVRNAVFEPNNLPRGLRHLRPSQQLNTHYTDRRVQNCGQPNHTFPPQIED